MPCTCARVATYLRRRVEVIKCGFSHWAETATRLRTSQLWKWPQLESVAKKYLFSRGTPHTVLVSDSTFIAERTSGVIRMGTLRLRLPGTWMRSMLYHHKQVNFADTHIQHSLVIYFVQFNTTTGTCSLQWCEGSRQCLALSLLWGRLLLSWSWWLVSWQDSMSNYLCSATDFSVKQYTFVFKVEEALWSDIIVLLYYNSAHEQNMCTAMINL